MGSIDTEDFGTYAAWARAIVTLIGAIAGIIALS